MAKATVQRTLGDRLRWKTAEVVGRREESAAAVTLVLDVPDWPGHLAGQHIDLRLTAEDGYSTQRSYSIASSPENKHLELTIQRLPDGEVSPTWRTKFGRETNWNCADRWADGSSGDRSRQNLSC